MQRTLLLKLLAIAGLSLVLLIPLWMIEGQIAGRSARQDEVTRDIAETAAGAQTLIGPVVLIRYVESVEHRDKDSKTGRDVMTHEMVEHSMVLPPQRLDINGDGKVETRSRGLYGARLFHLNLKMSGHIGISPNLGLDRSTNVASAQAILVLGFADPRGIDNDPDVAVNGRVEHFSTGALDVLPGAGVNLALGGVDIASGSTFDFAVPLKLTGSERLAIAPAGSATTVTLKSDWPHPSFQGRFLPITRTVTPAGFEAHWEVSHLARNFDSLLKTAAAGVVPETLDISFIQPVNIYLESERAVKYGILFIVLTFAAFFLTEILRRLAIHPLQYLLVGLALAIFFLLLIALSEHLKFGVAYALSAAACIALVGVYLSAVLGGRLRGVAFSGGLAALYAILYAVILSEDNALLMGAFLLFGALGATMLATRRVNWYALGVPANAEGS